MRSRASGVVFGAALLLCASAARAQQPAPSSCIIQDIADIPVSYNGVRVLADAKINDRDAKLIVDTGAFSNLIDESDARTLGWKGHLNPDMRVGGIGGYTNAGSGNFNLTLGKSVFRDEIFVVTNEGASRRSLGALIGRELLFQHDLDFDLPEGVLRVIKPVRCRDEEMVFWNKPYTEVGLDGASMDSAAYPEIRLIVFVNGQRVPALLDSGCPFSIITPMAASRVGSHKDVAELEHGTLGGIGHGLVSAKVSEFASFAVGEEKVSNVRLIVGDVWRYNKIEKTGTRLGDETAHTDLPEMILGADFLKAHHVLISPSHDRIYLSYMGGPVFGAPTRGGAASPPQTAPQQPPPVPAPH